MIRLFKAFPYDNGYDYTKLFSDREEQKAYFRSLQSEVIDETNYIKLDNSFNVEYEYEDMVNEGYNYLIFNNGVREFFAFIISKEYVRKNCTRIIYEVDVMQTFLTDFLLKNSFVERKVCNVSELVDYDEGLFIGEHTIVENNVAINKQSTFFALFQGIKQQVVNVDSEGKVTDAYTIPIQTGKPCTIVDGIQYPLYFLPLPDGNIPVSLADHPSLVAIVRFPKCSYSTETMKIPTLIPRDTGEYFTAFYVADIATNITSQSVSGGSYTIPKSDITDMFPYTYYVLTDGETEPLIMQPQYMSSSITVKGDFALSNQPVERYFVSSYKGDSRGNVYNITNTNQMLLATASNEGLSFLNANANVSKIQREGQVGSNILNAIGTIGGAVATGGISLAFGGFQSVASGVQQIKENDARTKDMLLTPSSISSFGTPSTRNAFDNNKVRLLKYSVSQQVKNKVKNFVKRYGNKYNNYATIDLKNYKGYIKFINPDIDSSIDNMYISKIREILERGIFIE